MTHILKEGEKVTVKALESMAQVVRESGYPQDPFIMQSDPREEFQIFVCLWRNVGHRGMSAVNVNVSEEP